MKRFKEENLNNPIVKELITQTESKKLGYGIKYAKRDGCCFACSENKDFTPVKYVVGKEISLDNVDKSNQECSTGIHLGKGFIGAGNYNVPEKIFFCTFNKKDLYGEGEDKWRVGKVKVVAELPLWMAYGSHGEEVLKKIGKKLTKTQINKYNPYIATKLPLLKDLIGNGLAQVWNQVWNQVGDQVGNQVGDQVWDQVRDQVWDQVWNQVRDQVRNQVWNQVRDQVGDQVWDQVWDQVRDQVWDQVGDQVGDQVWDQVWDQVRDQVWDQVGATSYWAVNIHFNLGISHWFGEFLKLGVMIIFVDGSVKVFGKKGKYLGEYSQEEFLEAVKKEKNEI